MPDKRANLALLARIAARQHGVVTLAQLREVGIARDGAQRRAAEGSLHRVHRGVYAVGHGRLTFEGRCMAALLACGPRVVLSHSSAAAVWRILSPPTGPIELSIPTTNGKRQREGIRIHRVGSLRESDLTIRRGFRLTRPSRTLRDVERSVSRPLYLKAVRRALDLRLISSDALTGEALTRSELERRFLSLCRRYRLPLPEVNVKVGKYEVDFLWRDVGLVVETDGFRHHGHRAAFESDRARDAELEAAGYRVLRFTYRQVLDSPAAVAEAVGAVIQPRLSP